MKRTFRLLWMSLVLVGSTACDQAIKYIARQSLIGQPPVSLLNDLIRIEYVENAGAILGLGASLPLALRVLLMFIFVAITLVAAFVLACKSPLEVGMMQLAGVSLVAAGGLGNLIDRILNQGKVIDFISFGIGGLRTGVMNLADMAIFFGALGFFVFYKLEQPAESTSNE